MPYRVRPSCRAAVCVLRLSPARRSASALNVSLYLRRLSGDVPLDLLAITEELFVFLLSVSPRPPQSTRICSRSGQVDCKRGKHILLRLNGDAAFVGLGNILTNKQAQASAFGSGFGGEKGREQLFFFNRRNARSVVLNVNFYFGIMKCGRDREHGLKIGVP